MIPLRMASAAITLMCVCLWAVPSRANPVTVNWDVVPHEFGELEQTPYYDCDGLVWGDRSCRYLWEQGLELSEGLFSFFDDKFFDGLGFGVPESDLPGLGVEYISPRCEPGLAPCFDAFTPIHLELTGDFLPPAVPPNLFVASSRGGLIKIPSLDGLASIDLQGPDWERLAWMDVGFYIPEACDVADPPEDLNCSLDQEKALIVESLTFQPVPEPAIITLLGLAMLRVARVRGVSRPRRIPR